MAGAGLLAYGNFSKQGAVVGIVGFGFRVYGRLPETLNTHEAPTGVALKN